MGEIHICLKMNGLTMEIYLDIHLTNCIFKSVYKGEKLRHYKKNVSVFVYINFFKVYIKILFMLYYLKI